MNTSQRLQIETEIFERKQELTRLTSEYNALRLWDLPNKFRISKRIKDVIQTIKMLNLEKSQIP